MNPENSFIIVLNIIHYLYFSQMLMMIISEIWPHPLYIFLVELPLTLFSLTSLAFIYNYYGSLLETQKTLISFLMRCFMVTSSIYLIIFKTVRFVEILLPEQVWVMFKYLFNTSGDG